MTTDEIKYQLSLVLEKQGKTLLDFEHELENLMEKKAANPKTVKEYLDNLGRVFKGLWTLGKGTTALPFALGGAAGVGLGYGAHGLYTAQQDSTEQMARLLEQKQKIDAARKEIEAQKIQQGLAY